MVYKTKQKLPYRAKLFVFVYVRDVEGRRSYQYGTDDGVPVSTTGADYFEIMKESAILNAIYKHFYAKGTPFNSKAKKQGGSYDYTNMVAKLDVRDYYFEYYGANNYTYKTKNVNGKRYIEVRNKGKFEHIERFNYKRDPFSNLEIL